MLPNPRELASHMSIHMNGKLFKCHICGKKTTASAKLKVVYKMWENKSKRIKYAAFSSR